MGRFTGRIAKTVLALTSFAPSGFAQAEAPSLAPITNVQESDRTRALHTIGRMYDAYVKNVLQIPSGMIPTGEIHDTPHEEITDKDKIFDLVKQFELDGEELRHLDKVRETGTPRIGEKQYALYTKDNDQEPYAVAITRTMENGDAKGEYWTLTNFEENKTSIRFGWRTANGSQDKLVRITWQPHQDGKKPRFYLEVRDTGGSWHHISTNYQEAVEEVLDKDAKKQELAR